MDVKNEVTGNKPVIWLCLLLMCIPVYARGIDIYVSPAGNDRAPGTLSAPVATLQQALDIARPHCGKDSVRILMRGGKYRVLSPVVIGPEHSGSKSFPVVIMSYPGEKATLSSSMVIDVDWKEYRNGVFETSLSVGDSVKFDRLFVNGVPATLARYPDRNPEVNIFEGYSADAIAPERISGWKNPKNGYVHAMHSSEWGGYQYIIEGKDSLGELMLGGGFQNNRMSGMHPEYRMVENIFEELDAPGEWFFDSDAAKLFYIPEGNMNLSASIFETPQSESLVWMVGEEDNPVEFVTIKDLELCETIRTFMKTSEPLLRSDWKIYRGGAVFFENTGHCSLFNCHLHEIGGNAVFFSGYNRYDSVSRNHIENIGGSAVCFVGRPESVREPLFEYNQSQNWYTIDHTPGPCGESYPALCYVTDNLIHSVGEVEKQVAGIQISMAMDITVSHNSIYRLPRAGINVSEGTWGGHVIEWNDVFDTVRETGDHGSFNSWGRDRYWHPNRSLMDSVVAANPEAPDIDAIHTTIIRNNRWRCDHGWDIDLDDGSSNYHIYNNLCLNGGLKLREGVGRVVENNVIVNNGFHPHVWFNESRDVFRHNIVTLGHKPIGINRWGEEVDSNFFATESGLESAQKNGTDAHSLAGNPQFVSPATGDYRVKDDSGARSIGFVNFPMDRFGVVYEPLRAIAEQPILPVYRLMDEHEETADDIFEWQGVNFKSVTTEGERSATGISSVKGVIVKANNNPAIDMLPNDVILEFNNVEINNADELLRQIQKLRTKSVKATIFRNQGPLSISIVL